MTSLRVKRKHQRRQRRRKLRCLRQRLAETRSASERQRLIGKIRSISPGAPIPEGQ